MPTYHYQCKACKHDFEEFQSMSAAPLLKCPKCGKRKLVRIISGAGLVFKGSGFYLTDYKKQGSSVPDSSRESKDSEDGGKESKPPQEGKKEGKKEGKGEGKESKGEPRESKGEARESKGETKERGSAGKGSSNGKA
jgi:putative FmdB family regulatory protein